MDRLAYAFAPQTQLKYLEEAVNGNGESGRLFYARLEQMSTQIRDDNRLSNVDIIDLCSTSKQGGRNVASKASSKPTSPTANRPFAALNALLESNKYDEIVDIFRAKMTNAGQNGDVTDLSKSSNFLILAMERSASYNANAANTRQLIELVKTSRVALNVRSLIRLFLLCSAKLVNWSTFTCVISFHQHLLPCVVYSKNEPMLALESLVDLDTNESIRKRLPSVYINLIVSTTVCFSKWN